MFLIIKDFDKEITGVKKVLIFACGRLLMRYGLLGSIFRTSKAFNLATN